MMASTGEPVPGHSTTSSNAMAAGTKRGTFIVLEGLDRSGKTTQVKLLEKRFENEGKPVKLMRFPDRTTPIGQMIDGYLKSDVEMDDHVIHLLFSANRWEAVKQMRAALASGTNIICDRFYHSGMVYSAAKLNPALSLSWSRSPDVGLPRPDIVLFLSLGEEAAKARGGWGDEKYEKAEMQRRVRQLFSTLSTGGTQEQEILKATGGLRDAQLRQDQEDLVVVDAAGTVEEVADALWERVSAKVDEVEKGVVSETVRSVE